MRRNWAKENPDLAIGESGVGKGERKSATGSLQPENRNPKLATVANLGQLTFEEHLVVGVPYDLRFRNIQVCRETPTTAQEGVGNRKTVIGNRNGSQPPALVGVSRGMPRTSNKDCREHQQLIFVRST